MKSRSSIALIIAMIFVLSLIAVWYVRGGPWFVEPVPTVSPLLLSDLENLNATATMGGRLAGFFCGDYCGEGQVPILIEAHLYTINNYTIRLQSETAIDLSDPVSTQWRSISKPDVLLGKKSHLLSWKDKDKDGKLGPSDQIQMNKTEPAPVVTRWCDVEEVEYGTICNITVTVDVTEDNIILRIETNIARNDTIRLENVTAVDLANPVCTQWFYESSLRDFVQKYHLLSWKDNNEDGKLSSSDRIKVNVTEKGGKRVNLEPRWCDVEEVEYSAIYYLSITNETIPDLSGNSTYVFNKLTRENLPDAPDEYPDKNRTGYDPFYPLRLKADEDIPNIWLDNINVTATLEFKGSVVKDGVTLYKYSFDKTITKELEDQGAGPGNHTLRNTKTVLIEPLSGIPVYTENETVKVTKGAVELLFLTYKDPKPDLATARLAHGAMEVLEFDKEVKGWILGVIVVILTVAFIFNTRSLARKMPPQAKT